MVYILKLAVNDLRNIIRDRMFVFLFFAYPVMLILISRIIVHLIAPRIENMFRLAGEFSVLFMFFILLSIQYVYKMPFLLENIIIRSKTLDKKSHMQFPTIPDYPH